MYTDKETLLAAQIAYYDFDPKVIAELTAQNQGAPPTLQELLEYDFAARGDNSILVGLKETFSNAETDSGKDSLEYERAQAAIERYEDISSGEVASGWRLTDYRNENNTTGMVGCVLDTGKGSAIVGFRGSEDIKTEQLFMDWLLADAGLFNSYQTIQQKSAENYMKYIDKRYGSKYSNFATSGHSLGGNLSVPYDPRNRLTQLSRGGVVTPMR